MTLPSTLIDAIGAMTERRGQTLDDALRLAAEWERLLPDLAERGARLREATSHRLCTCMHGEPDRQGRCQRCFGLMQTLTASKPGPP